MKAIHERWRVVSAGGRIAAIFTEDLRQIANVEDGKGVGGGEFEAERAKELAEHIVKLHNDFLEVSHER